MNAAVALSLNLLFHVRRMARRQGDRLLTSSQSAMLRKNLGDYINGRDCPTLVTLRSTYYLMRKANLPFTLVEPTDLPQNNLAIQVNNELLLLHWTSPARMRDWGIKFNGIRGSRKEVYNYSDGGVLSFEFVPVDFDNISFLKVCGFKVYTDYKRVNKLSTISSALDKRLFPYQVEGVRMLESGYRLLADEPGLGKTCQILQYTTLHPEFTRILVCCPASLKLNWRKEICMWTKHTEEDVQILSGSTPYEIDRKFAIINYDILPSWEHYLKTIQFDLVVSDECHYVQNIKAKRTQAFINVVRSADDTIFVSGTPFTSRPYQMFTALHTIAPNVFKNERDFGMRFCDPHLDYRGNYVYKGASNMDVLHDILKDGICVRRLKEEVLTELPDKMRVVVPVDTDEHELRADKQTYDLICELEQKIVNAPNPLGTLEWQKQIAYLRKKGEINKWVRDFLEGGRKLVVFATHKLTLDTLQSEFGSICVRIDGSTSMKDRDKAVRDFQNNPSVRLFLGNTQAAGVGLTLTAASDVLITEFPWTFAEVAQAEDRIHRVGQKNNAMIHYMCCPGTIDDMLMSIVNRKAAMHKRIFDGTTETNMLEIIRKEGGAKYRPKFIK